MFERFTEKARRVIFFARYEACQYGSATIETEHLLLGLMREDHALMARFVGAGGVAAQIREEIEKVIKGGNQISTSVDLPLSMDCKKILNRAAEEAQKLGHRHVGTEHLLLGILSVSESLAAKLLAARGAKEGEIREQIQKSGATPDNLVKTLDNFLGALKGTVSEGLAEFFVEHGRYIDADGKCWAGKEEIGKNAVTLFAAFAKRNVTFRLEEIVNGPGETAVGTMLWEFGASAGGQSKSIFRMSVVMAAAQEGWLIVLAQVTPVARNAKAGA